MFVALPMATLRNARVGCQSDKGTRWPGPFRNISPHIASCISFRQQRRRPVAQARGERQTPEARRHRDTRFPDLSRNIHACIGSCISFWRQRRCRIPPTREPKRGADALCKSKSVSQPKSTNARASAQAVDPGAITESSLFAPSDTEPVPTPSTCQSFTVPVAFTSFTGESGLHWPVGTRSSTYQVGLDRSCRHGREVSTRRRAGVCPHF